MSIFRLSVAVATAAPDTGVLLAATTRGPSSRPPSRACTAAIAWPSRSHWSAPAGAVAGVNSHGAGRNSGLWRFCAASRWLTEKALEYREIISQFRRFLTGRLQEGTRVFGAM